jgi:hypothetical protein
MKRNRPPMDKDEMLSWVALIVSALALIPQIIQLIDNIKA